MKKYFNKSAWAAETEGGWGQNKKTEGERFDTLINSQNYLNSILKIHL